MAKKEDEEVPTFFPILSRLDRLDQMLKFLEDKYFLMEKPLPCSVMRRTEAVDVEDQCVSLSAALELVKQKGSVVERLEFLENRILQLSIEMEVGNNTSRSNSSLVNTGDEDLDRQHLIEHRAPHIVETQKWTRRSRKKWGAGWRWLHMGCIT